MRDYAVPEWHHMLSAAGFTVQATTRRRIAIDFASWIARMQTPPVLAEAIRALQDKMPDDARAYFALAADGSFEMDTAALVAIKR